ncbi:ABC transporter substrate-binding protein [Salinadaptatus halalkaliphilus]|uniref:ABC transporter substrate-binding protein n=1 Tax=Salinadaptatus halalkaliphilus TaxID=2419781 RepID=UPI0015800B88|nr:ABC transporter substrate-binding protein [Salinadaptatus halalkaliphilus]
MDDDTLVATQPIWPESMDPQNHASSNTYDMINYSLYEPLLYNNEETDDDGNYIVDPYPGLATDWEFIDDDETELRFYLREGVTFHNGNELTPEDVVFSLKRGLDVEESEIGAPRETRVPTYEDAVAVEDEFAVDLIMSNATPKAIDRVCGYPSIMSKEFVENNDPAQEPNGTGPYQLEEAVEGEELVYTYYEDYWGEEPDFTTVRWNIASETQTQVSQVQAGETDLAVEINPQGLTQLRDDDNAHTATTPTPRSVFMQMRNVGDDTPFQSTEFRQAMCLAIDNEDVTDNVVGEYGEATTTLAPEFLPESHPDLEQYPYDPGRAEELVDESGFAGTSFELHTPQGRYLRDSEVAQAITEDIDSLSNVSCDVNIRDSNSWIDDLTSDNAADQPVASIVGWGGADFLVKTAVVQCSLVEGSWGGNCYDELEELIDEANQMSEWEPYLEASREISRWLHEEYVNVWLYNSFNLYGMSNRIDFDPRIDEAVYPQSATRNE